MRIIDLRSDTVTLPTEEMRKAMANAEVGDDVYGEDPTVKKLEERAAQIMGKEAGLFVPTGTMGNQIAVMTHTKRGDEIILEEKAHIFYYEVGGIAALSGVQARTLKGYYGALDPSEVEKSIRTGDIHEPRTSLICLENTHNKAGGTVIPLEIMKQIKEIGEKYNIPIHLDGARIFNAATALRVDVKEIAKYADSVMFCLSKGLCAPVGSMLVGTKEWIERARRNRKRLGGGMRQAGILAAAGLIALEKMPARLKEDHENARFLAEGLKEIPGIKVDMASIQTNIVFMDYEETGLTPDSFIAGLKKRGIKVNPGYPLVRMVTHLGINRDDINYTLQTIKEIVQGG